MKLFSTLALVFLFANQAHAADSLTCKGKFLDAQSTMEFTPTSNSDGQALLRADVSSDNYATFFKCKASAPGTSKLWECMEYPIGESFFRVVIERTPHGDWASVYGEMVGYSSTLLSTLDCRY